MRGNDMTILKERLEQLMRSFDESAEPISEAMISDALRTIHSENLEEDEESHFLLQAEEMAFGFHGPYPNDRNGWGTYYGPMIISTDKEG
jgi:hypothetical protein